MFGMLKPCEVGECCCCCCPCLSWSLASAAAALRIEGLGTSAGLITSDVESSIWMTRRGSVADEDRSFAGRSGFSSCSSWTELADELGLLDNGDCAGSVELLENFGRVSRGDVPRLNMLLEDEE